MSETQNSRFVYSIYIRTTPEKLFQALTDPALSPQYWRGMARLEAPAAVRPTRPISFFA